MILVTERLRSGQFDRAVIGAQEKCHNRQVNDDCSHVKIAGAMPILQVYPSIPNRATQRLN